MRLFGHPVHVMLCHFPVAFIAVAPLWDLMALFGAGEVFWTLGFWGALVAAVTALPVVVTGMLDWLRLSDDAAVGRLGMRHLLLMGAAVTLSVTALLLRGGADVPEVSAWLILAFDGLAVVSLVLGAWYGGEMILRHGVGSAHRQPRVVLEQARYRSS